jgi:hypothetical protein
VAALAELEPEIAATGHGVPLQGPAMREALWTLANRWQQDAVPATGRYVHRPAVTDHSGVVSVPPPVTDPQLLLLAGIGLAVMTAALLLASRSDESPNARGGSGPDDLCGLA